MRLDRLYLQNFRAFADETVDLAPGTVLIGPNDVGKSTILDAILFLLSPVDRHGDCWRWEGVAMAGALEGVAAVAGRFVDLTEPERLRWREALATDGSLLLGKRAAPPRGIVAGELGVFGPAVLLPGGPNDRQETPIRGDLAVEPGDGYTWQLVEEFLVRDHAEIATLPRMVLLPGPETPTPPPLTLLRPLLRRRLAASLGMTTEQLVHIASAGHSVTHPIVKRLAAEMGVGGAVDPNPWVFNRRLDQYLIDSPAPDGPDAILDVALDMNAIVSIDGLDEDLGGGLPVRGTGAPGDWPLPRGTGFVRHRALAALRLYGDPELWSPDLPLVVGIEEPEVGLHPAAQREVAHWLRAMPLKGNIQTIIVTHSTILIDAADRSGLRTVRMVREGDRRAARVGAELGDLVALLGVSPSDVLLPSTFVVVEGDTDARVLAVWARTLGYEVEASAVRFIAAQGWSAAEWTRRLVDNVYPSARIFVLLDKGPDSTREAERIQAAHEGRVVSRALREGEIEHYLPLDAVAAWMASESGMPTQEIQRDLEARAARQVPHGYVEDVLNRGSRRWLGRAYHKVGDGEAIARVVPRRAIPDEVGAFLGEVFASTR